MACYANVKPIIDVVVVVVDNDDDHCGFSHFIPIDSPYFRLESCVGSSVVVYTDVRSIASFLARLKHDGHCQTTGSRSCRVRSNVSCHFDVSRLTLRYCYSQTKNVLHDRTE